MAFACCWTGLVSYFWACTALPALLLLAGPEGEAGSWAATAARCRRRAARAGPALAAAAGRALAWSRGAAAAADVAWERAAAAAARPAVRGRAATGAPGGGGAAAAQAARRGAAGVRADEEQGGAEGGEVQRGDADFHFAGLPAVVEVPALSMPAPAEREPGAADTARARLSGARPGCRPAPGGRLPGPGSRGEHGSLLPGACSIHCACAFTRQDPGRMS